jgi:hypothetical protein
MLLTRQHTGPVVRGLTTDDGANARTGTYDNGQFVAAPSTSGHSNCRKVRSVPADRRLPWRSRPTRSATSLRSRCVSRGRTEQELSKSTTGVANIRAVQLKR